ncbi:SAV_915 family protein, partial [Streptacidiphilus neutrinimicus]|uniref:SAV_915 family protein n=1 Tax=Streptacidiphilus neutrinimicus TaxID=105420 RepID=UPI0007C6A1CB
MTRYMDGDDPEPAARVPAGRLLVPVRSGPAGDVLRLFRTPLGARTAVGFTSMRQLAAVLGREQGAVEIAETALRAMAATLGVTELTVDPQLAAAPAAALHGPDGWHPWRAHSPAAPDLVAPVAAERVRNGAGTPGARRGPGVAAATPGGSAPAGAPVTSGRSVTSRAPAPSGTSGAHRILGAPAASAGGPPARVRRRRC